MDEIELIESEAVTAVSPLPQQQHLSERDVERLAGVHPDMQAVVHYAIQICPHPFVVTRTGGVRSAATQARLYRDRRSKLDGVKRRSRHQTGHAVDVVSVVNGKVSWAFDHALTVHKAFMAAAHALSVVLRAGIDWNGNGDWRDESFVDAFHHELPREVYQDSLESKSPSAMRWMLALT